ncbi:hypothetical protein BYT27DRAFT_7335959 [Phlegmacium glaucopus]|nr:hypothetical protein BYT27DRAFT_7335959 [Phlegmacium glaucopus]
MSPTMRRKSDSAGILGRGSACLSCRRRKLKCTGTRPVCEQCNQMKRAHECQYDDSSKKSRTQTLREKVAVLEAKLRDLEDESSLSNFSPPICTSLPVDDQLSSPMIHSQDSGSSTFMLDPKDNLTDGSSSHGRMGTPRLDNLLTSYISTRQGMSPFSFTESSGGDSSSDQIFEPIISLSPEMHNALIQTFIRHHRQCCFYTNTSRFDSSSSATVFQCTPPNPSLMSAIYLLGSFFSHVPLPEDLQIQLLEQALRNVTRSLHNQEHLVDVVQASCLIAQYFFFNNRVMEGNRHLLAAKRMAYDLGLHAMSEPDVSTLSGYAYDSALQDMTEKSAVFWQVFMTDRFWSVTNHCDVSLPDRSPYRYTTTPLPVKEDVRLGVRTMNSSIHALFEDHFHVEWASLSTVAFKTIVSAIFDRSLRVHNSWPRDGGAWAFHVSAEATLKRLSSWVDPFTGREPSYPEEPYFDTDLYAIHTLILTSTIHLHFDNMSLKISKAANELLELINFLNPGDYRYLDPVLVTCWYSVVIGFRRIMNINAIGNRGDSMPSYTNAFLRRGTDILLNALKNMSPYVPVAGSLIQDLDLEDWRMAPIITTTARYSKELHVISDSEHRHYTTVH